MNRPIIPIAVRGDSRERKRQAPKGRRVDPRALIEVQALLGEESRQSAWPQFCSGFPGGACSDASLVLGAILDDAGHTGLECAWGEIVKPNGTKSSHGWLQRGDLIVDITADQFDDVAEPVIVSRASPWHRRWRIVTMSYLT